MPSYKEKFQSLNLASMYCLKAKPIHISKGQHPKMADIQCGFFDESSANSSNEKNVDTPDRFSDEFVMTNLDGWAVSEGELMKTKSCIEISETNGYVRFETYSLGKPAIVKYRILDTFISGQGKIFILGCGFILWDRAELGMCIS